MYELTQEKFTKANKLLLKDLHSSLGIDKSALSNNQLLQKLSQAFFSKPFEEIQKTIFNESNEVSDNGVSRVFIFHYGGESILSVDGCFDISTCEPGADGHKKIEFNDLFSEAEKVAKKLNAFPFSEVTLPEILESDWIEEDVITLAKKIGYFKYQTTLFGLIDSNTTKNFIDGEYVPFSLDGEWEEKMIGEHEEYPEEKIGDCFIWSAEVGTNKSPDFKEYFFTFNDICNAVLRDDGSWLIKENNEVDHKLTFSKDM